MDSSIQLAVCVLATALLSGCATTHTLSLSEMRAEADRSAPPPPAAPDLASLGSELKRVAFVQLVLDRNPSLEMARQAWKGALARVRRAGALQDPAVEFQLAPLSIASTNARLGFQAMISQQLPWPGKLILEDDAAKYDADAAKSDFEQARRELALAAAVLYDDYFFVARSLEINVQNAALVRDLKADALIQLEAARASIADPIAAEAELAHLEHDAIMLSTDRDVVVAQMNELLHRDPEAPLPPPPATLRSPDAISGHLADDRPDIRAAHSRSLAAVARADRARRDWVPDLTLSTTYNSMWDMPEHRWMVGLGLTLPIELGHRAGAVDEAEAERVGYEAQVMALGDKARTAVTIATRRLEEARHLERLLEEKLTPIAHAQVDAARSGFATSRNDFATVIAAERNLRSVQLDAERASADIDRRAAELDYAMGRMPGPSGRGAAR